MDKSQENSYQEIPDLKRQICFEPGKAFVQAKALIDSHFSKYLAKQAIDGDFSEFHAVELHHDAQLLKHIIKALLFETF